MASRRTTRGGFRLVGKEAMTRKLLDLSRRYPKAAAQELRLEAEEIMTTSKRDHVPVDLGTLRASGRVGRVKTTRRYIRVPMRYGSAAAPYALAIHEHPSSHSPPTWQGKPISEIRSVREGDPWSLAGRGPQYLARPMREALRGMDDRLARRLSTNRISSQGGRR